MPLGRLTQRIASHNGPISCKSGAAGMVPVRWPGGNRYRISPVAGSAGLAPETSLRLAPLTFEYAGLSLRLGEGRLRGKSAGTEILESLPRSIGQADRSAVG